MSQWTRPQPEEFWRAADIYLEHAYGTQGQTVPPAVSARLETLRQCRDLFAAPAFERTPKDEPSKYSLRLGNARYPHMKLVIGRTPGGDGHLFKADTHDKHIRPPPGSKDEAAFRELMEFNERVAQAIEAEWEAAGLRTFKVFLREDLERRRA
jgi:hypothetical protein